MNRARMNPERWREIKPLLESALELDVGDRRAFLDETCAGDQSLKCEVESLIAAHERAGDFMETPAFEEAARMLAEERIAQETTHIYETSSEEKPHNAPTLIDDRKSILLAPGEILDGRYLIERELEPGGVGQVFLARNLKLPSGAEVVVKVLREQILEGEDRAWFEKKFRAEILALSRINHPGVVSALDAGQLPDGRAYFVMQYVPGRTLQSVMTTRGMNPKLVADLIRKIAQALDAAHEQCVIHRDLKPANIMLQTSGHEEYIKIIDFGIATVLETSLAQALNATRVVGTLPYMAPEQFQGLPSAASDIFALGVIAFEMVTGQLPFKADTITQQIELQRAGVEEKLRHLCAELPEAVRAAIQKAMAFEPSNRYRAAREFSKAFDRALAEPERSAPFQTTSGAPAIRQFEAIQAAKRRRRWPLLIVGLIALLATAAVGTIAWRRLATAPEGKPIATKANPPAGAERILSYSLEARRNPKLHPGAASFIPTSDTIFKAGDEVRLRVTSPQACYLYAVNEAPERADDLPVFTLMFPINGDSAQIAANKMIQILASDEDPEGWFEFVDEKAGVENETGVEKIWLIWSERNLAEMESIKYLANRIDMGLVSDPEQIRRLDSYLKALAQTTVELEKDEKSGMTKFKGRGEVLAGVVRLEHR
jgi:serine/threonine protein kinase